MIAVLLGTMLAFAGSPQEAQNLERMRVTPMSEADAVSEFENACFRVRDPDALARTATTSVRRYVEASAAAGTATLVRSWASPYGTISYVERKPGHDGKGFRECSFTAYTRDSVNRFVLNRQLGDMVARRADSHLVEIQDPKAMGWLWRDAQAHRTALYSIADSNTPHQITLSLRSEDGTQ
jgi:hypothetical protein